MAAGKSLCSAVLKGTLAALDLIVLKVKLASPDLIGVRLALTPLDLNILKVTVLGQRCTQHQLASTSLPIPLGGRVQCFQQALHAHFLHHRSCLVSPVLGLETALETMVLEMMVLEMRVLEMRVLEMRVLEMRVLEMMVAPVEL